jgi:hypothetical protein
VTHSWTLSGTKVYPLEESPSFLPRNKEVLFNKIGSPCTVVEGSFDEREYAKKQGWEPWSLEEIRDVLTGQKKSKRPNPLPNGQRRGHSAVPGIPLFPLLLWVIASVIDLLVDSWGTWIVAALHAAFAIVLVVSIVRDCCRLPEAG